MKLPRNRTLLDLFVFDFVSHFIGFISYCYTQTLSVIPVFLSSGKSSASDVQMVRHTSRVWTRLWTKLWYYASSFKQCAIGHRINRFTTEEKIENLESNLISSTLKTEMAAQQHGFVYTRIDAILLYYLNSILLMLTINFKFDFVFTMSQPQLAEGHCLVEMLEIVVLETHKHQIIHISWIGFLFK